MIVWRVPLTGVRAAFRNMEMGNLCLAIFCFLALLALRAYKWHGLMAAAGSGHLRRSLRALFGGFALGLITPGRLGELARCVFVRQEERAQVALLTILDRLLDFWALLTLMAVSLFWVAARPVAFVGVAVWLALLPMVMKFPSLVSCLAKLARKSRHLRGHFSEVAGAMPQVSTPRFAILAVGAIGMELTSFFFLLRAFSPTGFAAVVATYPYIVLAGDLPVSIGGVGVREGAAALLLSPYAVPTGAAVGASLMWFVFAILVPAALGACWLVMERAGSWRRRLDAVGDKVQLTWNPVLPCPDPTALCPELAATPQCEVEG
jgi:uncharacterized membrane protein YbhN (UPF0104 family)